MYNRNLFPDKEIALWELEKGILSIDDLLAQPEIIWPKYEMARYSWEQGNAAGFIGEKRRHFKNCIKLLVDLYQEGEVESVIGLPGPIELKSYNGFDLSHLSCHLERRYFPEHYMLEP